MFGEANFGSDGQSLGGGKGKARREKPLKACLKYEIGSAALLLRMAGSQAMLELAAPRCSQPGGLVPRWVTAARRV